MNVQEKENPVANDKNRCAGAAMFLWVDFPFWKSPPILVLGVESKPP